MASTGAIDAADPDNSLWHRFEPRRLTAEELRDSMLAVGGTLNPALGGPPVYPPLPDEVLATASRPGDAWGRSSPEDAARRSVFVHVKRSLRHPLLHAFDPADTDTACPVRFVTMPPTQSLILLNSEESNACAEQFRKRLEQEAKTLLGRCVRGLELVTQEPAVSSDVDQLVELHGDLMGEGLSDEEAMKYVCLTMLNLNAFAFLD